MSEELNLPESADRETLYQSLVPQIAALLNGESDSVANMANFCAVLRQAFGFFWVGFYRLQGSTLILGPFQGPLACTRIPVGKGVCGTAARDRKTILVPDVDAFPGHIACSSASRSEIVVPMLDAQGNLHGVLDIDSDQLDDFTETDRVYLEKLVETLMDRSTF